MGLRTRIIMLMGLVLSIAALLFGFATFRAQENALLRGIDARLEATARLAKEILPAEYHDKISGADSVSEAEYLRMVERWNRLCTQMGLEYIWSLMRIDGKIVFTSATSTSKDINKGDYARFFEMHSTPELYAAAFASMKPQYQINDNKWGRTKVVLLPFEDARGRPFLFGASMKTTAVDALTRKTIWQSLEISAGILFFGVFLSVLLAGSLVRPLEMLTDLARSITKGNWGQVVETSGAIEIRSLAHSVNEMSRSIQEKITDLKRAEQEESLVNEIGRVVGSTLNINQVFERVATEVSKLLPYDRLLVNRKKNDNEFIVVYASGVDNPGRRLADSYPSRGTTTGLVMATRKGILVQPMDAEEIKDLYSNLYVTFKTGLRSTMSVPLISNDEVIGSLSIRSGKLQAYTEQDLRLAERIGMQVAGAIVNAQMFNDLTKTEKSLRESEERLQRAEKMEALGQMAGGVAHDLNNVLGILSGYSELLLLEIPEGSRHRGHVEKILQSTQKGAAIIQDLLTLARRGVAASDVVSLNSVVSDFLKSPVFEKMKDFNPRVTFRTECDKDLLNIKGSSVHLEKTLVNLVSNAAEAISGEGEVTIRTESRYIDKPLRGYDEVKDGDYAVLTVSDTGMGILAENREKIFEPFYTKKKMGRSGTGLGLAIVWGTVKDHNGYIDLQTEVGKGTTFTLYFPVTREEPIAQQQKEPVEQYMGNGESVLVVDDIAEQRDIAARLLTRLGYEVHLVSSGEEAVEYLKNNKADILVLDMIMEPGIDGLATYQRVLAINQKQKAIIVSGFSQTDRVREAQRLGAGAYVKKPYVMEKIGVAIRDELNR